MGKTRVTSNAALLGRYFFGNTQRHKKERPKHSFINGNNRNSAFDTVINGNPSAKAAEESIRAALDTRQVQLSKKEFDVYFSNPSDRHKVLRGLNRIWESGYLFNSNDNASKEYFELVKLISKSNDDFFQQSSQDGISNTWLTHELDILLKNKHLDELTKALVATQALELALMGVHITPVLGKINQAKYLNESSGRRQELLANWYLAKFIFPDYADKPPYQIRASITINTHDGGTKEIDIKAPNILVEVQQNARITDKKNEFASEMRDLFEAIVNANGVLNLKKHTKKLMFVTGTDELALCSKHFDCSDIEKDAVLKARSQIRGLTSEDERVKNHLFQDSNVHLMYTPYVTSNRLINGWVKVLYSEYNQAA